MRKKLLAVMAFSTFAATAQDSLSTTNLPEVVVTGTKFDLPIEKSGKTIFKITSEELGQNAGKSLADLLNEVPGIQMDGNFGTPGSNISYFVRGARNKHTLILIDGVPLNDPSAINAEYDLRYIPVSQIESVEILKGGLSTLYGTSASAGVINIKLKEPSEKISGSVDLGYGSFKTFSQNAQVGGTSGEFSFLVSGSNTTSEGFSSALDNDGAFEFDKDGFDRQNGLLKLGWRSSENFSINFQSAYEQFEADYDDFEFADAPNTQRYQQFRLGITPEMRYEKGSLQANFFYNNNQREFESSYPTAPSGKNFQAEVIHRHQFSNAIQTLAGVNFQHMRYDDKEFGMRTVSADTARSTLLDPYASLFIDLPSGFNLHTGVRLNTHSVYGSRFLYNVNPSYVLNQEGKWKYKLLASVATSFVTPSLFQLYSIYGNEELKPEESLNYEAGISIYKTGLTIDATWFARKETNPIDFFSFFDDDGNYIGSRYENVTAERTVDGFEFNVEYTISKRIKVAGNVATVDSDKPESLTRIPKRKFGLQLSVEPIESLAVMIKYNYTGERSTQYFLVPDPIILQSYQLVDVFVSYSALKKKLTIYGAVNNLFDEDFVAIYGYTTRGRNFSTGIRYNF